MSDLASGIKSILFNDEISDLTLIGSDGDSILTIKAILAARSKVFRRMLYGEFTETSSRKVRLDYTGAVLRVVMEFCFTDDGNASHHFDGLGAESFVRSLVQVAAAAHYFDIPRLETDVFQKLTEMIADLPSLACVVYDESIKFGNPLEALSGMAMKKIRERPRSSLLPAKENVGGVLSLDESLLETIVFNEQSTASEFVKFQCLQQWVESDKNGGAKGTKDDSKEVPTEVRRTEGTDEKKSEVSEQLSTTITDLAKRVDLSRIPASELSSVVAQSHLVTRDDLYQAYRSRALFTQRTTNKIVVEGAGTPEVNGIYIQEGLYEGTPIYNKEGVWDDREIIFSIFFRQFSGCWSISILPKEKEPEMKFYFCEPLSGEIIPSYGWEPCKNGLAPSPMCEFVTGCLDDKGSM